ncbi:phage tail-type lysozyme domain-containing protein [Methylobacterium sp. NMS14P]|uniref:phage tail tip lysozyme n=1 Tax=Methylobacterium sp. NMS14P TaxID=2894310 RepID=UPI0023585C06|nr:phage tail tip lysozyme [Methylobacterium sp. NMS14P]WCS24680.1 phage tail-type lysozyme domain-containing protein [Methylobacterium sp. NMS14P]
MPPPAPAAQEPFAAACRRLGPRLMRDLGLSDLQAAGLLGNLGHETGGFRRLQEVAPAVPGSRGGWGLAQWTGPRRVAMEAWCRARGLDPADPEAGYGYLCAELRGTEASALAALRATTTLAAAAEAVWRRYERPGVVAPARRLAWARRALAALREAPVTPASGRP